MSYADQWKAAKQRFETSTGRKKPTEKVLGAFRKGTGIEAAARVLDKAVEERDQERIVKAATELAKAANTYIGVLRAAAKEEHNKAIEGDIDTLRATFDTWGQAASDDAKNAIANDVKQAADQWEADDEKQMGTLKTLVADGRSAVTDVRGAISSLIEATASGNQNGVKTAAAAIKNGMATLDTSCKKLEAIATDLKKSRALLQQKANLASIGRGTPIGRQVSNVSNVSQLTDQVDLMGANLREQQAALSESIASALQDAKRGTVSREQRIEGILKLFASWVERHGVLERNTNELLNREKALVKDYVAWHQGGRGDPAVGRRLRLTASELVVAIPKLDDQLVALNKTVIAYVVPTDLTNDDKVRKAFGSDRKLIFDENEARMKQIADAKRRVEQVVSGL